jgi:hypothetical protein
MQCTVIQLSKRLSANSLPYALSLSHSSSNFQIKQTASSHDQHAAYQPNTKASSSLAEKLAMPLAYTNILIFTLTYFFTISQTPCMQKKLNRAAYIRLTYN